MNITELVKDKKVKFSYYRDGNLWYVCENGFAFPVPISDTGTGMFMAEDKALFFMRWIRKHLEIIDNELKNYVGVIENEKGTGPLDREVQATHNN